ncbi:MAG: prepilin peptidase [Rickettsiales bacterium]|nr:prepilin peptidase [Rickettsiales bacterium]
MAALVFILGLCFGSFLTLVSYRLPRGERIGMTRSACPSCHTPLGAPDLLPVLSWLWFRAACRHCRKPVSWRYPAIELVTAAALLCVYYVHGVQGGGLLLIALTLCLLVMMIVDFEHYIIPDEIQIAVGVLAVIYHLNFGLHPASMLAGGIAGGLIGWAMQQGYRWSRKRDGLGTGDVKFLVVAGLWVGAPALMPLLFFSGLLGIGTAALWRCLGRGALFPFGPALALSLWILLLWPHVVDMFFGWPNAVAQWLLNNT